MTDHMELIEIYIPPKDKDAFTSKFRDLFQSKSVYGTPLLESDDWDYIVIRTDHTPPIAEHLTTFEGVKDD